MNSKTSDQSFDGGAWGGAADGSLGQQLRRAREARGVTLREISEQTRITIRHLEAIEADDYKHLPGGIFNKSFVKAYARQVGFDERIALELYARTAREHGDPEEVPTSPQRSRVYTSEAARSPLVTAGLSAVIIGVLILIIYAGLHYYRRTEGDASGAPTPTPAAAASPQAQTAPAAPQAEPDRLNVQIKALEEVWLKALTDDEPDKGNAGLTLAPNDTREFSAQQKLTLKYARSKVGAFEVTINGGRARVPTDTTLNAGQGWVITKENYRQFLQ